MCKVMQLWVYQFIFNEVAHNLVVEVLDGSPLDAFLNVLFLREKYNTRKELKGKRKTVDLKYLQPDSEWIIQRLALCLYQTDLLLLNILQKLRDKEAISQKSNKFIVATCSAFRVSSIKICCSFSLTKLIQNCSKPFLCRGRTQSGLYQIITTVNQILLCCTIYKTNICYFSICL